MIRIRAVDFNLWMSIISLTKRRVQSSDVTGYITVPVNNILPEYPRDLSGLKKPSIIIQKVADDISDICFSNGFIGQGFDDTVGANIDVNSRFHELQYQFDVFGDNNTQCSLLTSLATDDIFTSNNIDIYDYLADQNNPPLVGIGKLRNDVDVIQMNPDKNNNYRTAIRFYVDVIQTMIPVQDIVDLSKWIKVAQTIK